MYMGKKEFIVKIIDTHAHYDSKAFDEDRDEVLNALFAGGTVGAVINSCAEFDEINRTVELAHRYPNVYMTAGVHPDNIEKLEQDGALFALKAAASDKKCVGIGEIGLDYYWEKDKKEQMKKGFRKQIELALSMKLPIVVHSRDAAEDTLKIISEYYPVIERKSFTEDMSETGNLPAGSRANGVIHCFSYSKEIAEEYIKRGFLLGIGGVVTFENAKNIKNVAESVSLFDIVLETDCPYLAPKPFRGQRNNSELLTYVAEKIAHIKGVTMEDVINITTQNAVRLYGINKDFVL